MRHKIFISYRRDDSTPEALSIAQFLEREFGNRVFMDIDIPAGAQFSRILDRRLAESKVLLAIIGPNWLSAKDSEGRRRLELADDWVRMEISHALAAHIAVIPVCINTATLPARGDLPDDLKRLVEHQAAFVSTAHFRNDMAGLVRDIRVLFDPLSLARVGGFVATLVLLASAVLLILSFFTRKHNTAQPESPAAAKHTDSAVPPQLESAKLNGSIQFRSQPGDYIGEGKSWTVTNADGVLTAQINNNSLDINYQGDDSWDITLAAPQGQRLLPGLYSNASRVPFNSPMKPGLSVDGAGRGCNTLTGQFNVRKIEYSPSGALKRLLADFQQHCEDRSPALFGAIDVTASENTSKPR